MKTNDYSYHMRREGAAQVGAFEDLNWRERMRALLKPEEATTEEPVAAPVPRWRRLLEVTGLVFQLVVITKGSIEWTGPRLTPAEAADVMRANRGGANMTDFISVATEDGPQLYVAPCVECDVQRSIAEADAWRRAGFVVSRYGFYARPTIGSMRLTSRDAGPLYRPVARRSNEQRNVK